MAMFDANIFGWTLSKYSKNHSLYIVEVLILILKTPKFEM